MGNDGAPNHRNGRIDPPLRPFHIGATSHLGHTSAMAASVGPGHAALHSRRLMWVIRYSLLRAENRSMSAMLLQRLWYPIGVAAMTLVVGASMLRDTKDVDISVGSGAEAAQRA